MFERATRGCAASRRQWRPSRPASRFLRSRMVKASSRACVGCSCVPSPALMMAERQMRERKWQAPEDGVAQDDHVW